MQDFYDWRFRLNSIQTAAISDKNCKWHRYSHGRLERVRKIGLPQLSGTRSIPSLRVRDEEETFLPKTLTLALEPIQLRYLFHSHIDHIIVTENIMFGKTLVPFNDDN